MELNSRGKNRLERQVTVRFGLDLRLIQSLTQKKKITLEFGTNQELIT